MSARLIRTLFVISACLLFILLAYLGFRTARENPVGWYLIFTALGYALGGPYLIRSHLVAQPVVRQESRSTSFWLILPGFLVVYYASPLEYLYLPGLLPAFRTAWMQFFALGLIAISMLLFISARLALKGFYSGRLQVLAGHALVQHGPYRVIRHPAYLAYIFMCLGIALGYSSLLGLLALPLLLIPALLYRIRVEEQLLSTEFGDQYRHYCRATRKLIPGIW